MCANIGRAAWNFLAGLEPLWSTDIDLPAFLVLLMTDPLPRCAAAPAAMDMDLFCAWRGRLGEGLLDGIEPGVKASWWLLSGGGRLVMRTAAVLILRLGEALLLPPPPAEEVDRLMRGTMLTRL